MKTRRPIPKGLSSKTYPGVFKLVLVTQEETETGIATKPVLQQKEVVRLCHKLAPKKVKAKADPSKLVLSDLDDIPLRIIGIYGNDEEIAHFLCKDCNFEESIYCLKENVREYPRGLYALLAQPNLLFVLFLQRQSTATHSGIDKTSVRFLRYLRELSTHIHIVFDSTQLKELERQANYEDEDDESDEDEAYTKRLAPQKLLSISTSDMKFVEEFQCDLSKSIPSSKSTNLIASHGHEGYAIFQTLTSTALRLECERAVDLDARLSEFSIVESPKMVSMELPVTKSAELLCLNCVSTSAVRRLLAVIRKSSKDCNKVLVVGGPMIRPNREIRTFSNIVPTAFAFRDKLISWYDINNNEVCVFELATDYREMKILHCIPLPESSRKDEIKFQEFLNEERLLIVDCHNRGRIIDVNSKEVVKRFDLPDGLLDLCSLSSTYLVCAHANSSSLSCSIVQIQPSKASVVGSFKIDMPHVHLQTLRIVKFHGHCFFTAIDSHSSKLVSWRTTASDRDQTVQARKTFAGPVDMLKGLQTIFEEYSVRHCYESHVKPLALSFPVYEGSTSFISRLETAMQNRIQAYLRKVKERLHKKVDEINLDVVAFSAMDAPSLQLSVEAVSLGNWVRQLVPTVPVQIARIENSCLVPVVNGLKLTVHNVKSPEQLVPKLSFGLVETLFADAAIKQLPVKVASAQGKQSTGKSYFLNHLAGAHFDTSGWRCTEGIWMCAKILPDLLLVLLDFEGRSTEERTVQEDCLLASFGAALSSVVIMKNEMRMEVNDINFLSLALKEAAQRLSTGKSQSHALYNGTLCVVLKDVSHDDREAAGEVVEKIQNRMSKAIRNICDDDSEVVDDSDKLRKGLFENCTVTCQRPLTHKHFYKALKSVKREIDEKPRIPIPHSELVITMKSILANLHLSGVVNAEDTSYTVLEDRLDRHMETAIQFGAVEFTDGNVIEHLTSYEGDRTVIEDCNDSKYFGLNDAGLQLCSWMADENSTNISRQTVVVADKQEKFLLDRYRKKISKRDKDDTGWVLNLQTFYLALVDRRISRIKTWIDLNLPCDKNLNQTLIQRKRNFLELCDSRYFESLRKKWEICKHFCSQRKALDTPCLRLCIRLATICQCEGTGCDRCNCYETNHLCNEPCFYCLRGRECNSQNPNLCAYGAKHKGNHNCRKTKHLCSQPCHKQDISHGCNKYCQYSIVDNHPVHECEAQHKCISECSAQNCTSSCEFDLKHSITDSDREHDCGKKVCLEECYIKGCSLPCRSSDHFHYLDEGDPHFCNKTRHLCVDALCSVNGGRCNNKESFGKLPCSLTIEGKQPDHPGPHFCDTDHFCDEQCSCGCLEYCIRKLEMRRDESRGQRAFLAHKGACSTSQHTFSNRTEKEFQETIEKLSQIARKAVQTGAIAMTSNAITEHLHSFGEPSKTVSDSDDQFYGLCDAGLKLCDWSQSESSDGSLTVLPSTADFLVLQFRTNFPTTRKGNDKFWIDNCQDFINSVIARRIARVTTWIEINFPAKGRLSTQLVLTLDSLIEIYRKQYFSVLTNEWRLCRNVCQQKTGKSKQCQRECLRLRSICCNSQSKGCEDCDCLEEDHSCPEKCDNCLNSLSGMSNPKLCQLGAEHDLYVPHMCDELSHKCKEKCSKLQARNCMKKCSISYETKHDRHLCGAGTKHKCTSVCSACEEICDFEFEHDATSCQTLHRCAQLKCNKLCEMKDCDCQCAEDHLHCIEVPQSPHFCSKEHVCVGHSCSVKEGRCLKIKTVKAPCAVRIPSKQHFHNESHYCGNVHYCNQRCPCGCNEACTKKMQLQQNATQKICFVKHVGFCHTEKHTFADSPVTGLDQLLDKLGVTVKQKTAVGVKEISNDVSDSVAGSAAEVAGSAAKVAGSAAEVACKFQQQLCAEGFGKLKNFREPTFRLCDEDMKGKVVVTHKLLVSLIAEFKKKKNRDDESEVRWKQKLETYISGVIKKRIDSVMELIGRELPKNECLDSDVVVSSLNRFKQRCSIEIFERLQKQWKLCPRVCSQREIDCERCQRSCLKLAIECADNAQTVDCNCLEDDHRCKENCSQCLIAFGLQSKRNSLKTRCLFGARHKDKQHRCYRKEHPCPEKCMKSAARGCLGICSRKIENHPELHLCSSESKHKCTEFCSAKDLGCNKRCEEEFEHQLQQNNSLHFCGEGRCMKKCQHLGCSSGCAIKDHFHGRDKRARHLCNKLRHDCNETCTVQGGRCPDRYDMSKNPCVVPINDSGISHEGPHYCGHIHFCSNRCPCCDAFCNKQLVFVKDKRLRITEFKSHKGLCNTDAHQTAKNLTIENSLGYTEASCKGEWCGNVCNRLGRGHLHLVPCKTHNFCTGRHTMTSSGQRLDQLRHDIFWKEFAHFEDPCKDIQQQKIFRMCPAYCSTKAESEMKSNSESFCKGELWHADFLKTTDACSHVTDGHRFECRHCRHIILVVDCSGSMQSPFNADKGFQAMPSTVQPRRKFSYGSIDTAWSFKPSRSRLDWVKNASIDFLKQLKESSETTMVSVISFSDSSQTVIDSADVATACQHLQSTEWTNVGGGGTRYIPAVDQVKSILSIGRSLKMKRNFYYEPAVFFLSDGLPGDTGADTAVRQLVAQYKATFSTCLFGPDDHQAQEVLFQMSTSGRGKFYRAPTGTELQRNLYDFKAFLYKTRTISGYY